jgi:dextranase
MKAASKDNRAWQASIRRDSKVKDFWKKPAVIGAQLLLVGALLTACLEDSATVDPQEAGDADLFTYVTTDKARYNPGDKVSYTLDLEESAQGGTIRVQYKYLDEQIGHTTIKWDGSPEVNWEWEPPADDYRGYMTEIYLEQDKVISDHVNISVDVSSDWGKFPRYGYLADFMAMEAQEQEAVIEKLNRYRINGVQFYDWQWKHHEPLKMNGEAPASEWPDIANRTVSFDTVKKYIDLAHAKNMKAMNYNLLFGAYEDSDKDGVKKEWGLYRDPLQQNQDKHPLPDNWASDILLLNPGNEAWQSYLFEAEKEVYNHLPFDGWHVDQLGDRGTLYDGEGKKVDIQQTYKPFLEAAKKAIDVDYVMNAVGQFGQAFIAQSPVKFLYTEVWDGHPQYRNLKEIVDQNGKFSKGKLNTVFAGYMNYDYSNQTGEFNAPGVLLADAVMFASGASHLELGENMLSKEYFPHKNLKITDELASSLTSYYDFLVAYQNLLRDNVQEVELDVTSSDVELSVSPEIGRIWEFAKEANGKQVIHLINFSNATHLNWNDTDASQAEPVEIQNMNLAIQSDKKVSQVWVASPDAMDGSAIPVEFVQKNGMITITLPSLKYWSMTVIEYE